MPGGGDRFGNEEDVVEPRLAGDGIEHGLRPRIGLSVAIDGTAVFERGAPTGLVPELTGPAMTIDLDLGLGTGSAAYLASDLTYDYVRLNAEYTT